VGGPADPLEYGPVLPAPDARDLLGPVRKDGAGVTRDLAHVVGRRRVGIAEGGARCEQALPVAAAGHIDGRFGLPRPGVPIHHVSSASSFFLSTLPAAVRGSGSVVSSRRRGSL